MVGISNALSYKFCRGIILILIIIAVTGLRRQEFCLLASNPVSQSILLRKNRSQNKSLHPPIKSSNFFLCTFVREPPSSHAQVQLDPFLFCHVSLTAKRQIVIGPFVQTSANSLVGPAVPRAIDQVYKPISTFAP